ncbi:MAG: hypothetical protein EA355_10485 [Rhodobacteraceae bacterium]|nr:MAG: hypothetical protein EA355_10485 [Paracoccaceae bacterium]
MWKAPTLAAALTGLVLAGAAHADQPEPPEAEDRVRIVEALIADGFISWGDIETAEDGEAWVVERATADDEQDYAVEIDRSFRVARRLLD